MSYYQFALVDYIVFHDRGMLQAGDCGDTKDCFDYEILICVAKAMIILHRREKTSFMEKKTQETELFDPAGRKKFAKYVSLNILAMLGSSCYIVADTFFVAMGVGADGLAALNLAIVLFSFMQAMGLLIGIGSGTGYGVRKSRGDFKDGNRIFTIALMTGIAAGTVFLLVGNLFSSQLAHLMGADSRIMGLTALYIRVIFTCAPFFICNHILVAFVRNDENPRLAAIALLISNGSNIILDYVFICLFNWSMFGAAAATGLSPVISICVLSRHFIGKKNRFRFIGRNTFCGVADTASAVWEFCRLGVSSMVNELSVGLVVMIFNFLFLGLGGNTAVAAYGVVTNVGLFAFAIFTGAAQGVQPLVSDYYGRGITGQIRIIRRDTLMVTAALALVLIAAVYGFTGEIAAAFNESGDPVMQKIAEEGLRIYFLCFLFGGANIAMTGYFSAMERADLGFSISLLRGFLIIAPCAVIFSRLFGMTGIWISVPVTEAVTFVLMLLMMRKKLPQTF